MYPSRKNQQHEEEQILDKKCSKCSDPIKGIKNSKDSKVFYSSELCKDCIANNFREMVQSAQVL